MNPITELHELLARLSPRLEPGEYLFCTLRGVVEPPAHLQALATIREPEGLSLVIDQHQAQGLGLPASGPFRLITLRVHSSLEAVGLTAAVSTALAGAGISANVIAGYHHDHLLVPAGRAGQALAVLQDLATSAQGRRQG